MQPKWTVAGDFTPMSCHLSGVNGAGEININGFVGFLQLLDPCLGVGGSGVGPGEIASVVPVSVSGVPMKTVGLQVFRETASYFDL